MKTITKIVLLISIITSFASCKKESAIPNNLIASWVKMPVSPGGNTYLKITDASNFQIGYTLGPNYTQTSQGTYIYTASQATFYNTAGAFTPCSNVPGNYQYKVVSNQLTLTLISDACVDSAGSQRSNTIAGSWTQ